MFAGDSSSGVRSLANTVTATVAGAPGVDGPWGRGSVLSYTSKPTRSPLVPAVRSVRPSHPAHVFPDLAHRPNRKDLLRLTVKDEQELEDVIDLGAPRGVRGTWSPKRSSTRAPRLYTPNPRLYPGPQKPVQAKQKRKSSGYRGRVKKQVFRRPVPNSRLYRPAPRRPPPAPRPPPYPRTTWRPQPARSLETASRAALLLNENLSKVQQRRSSLPVLVERKRIKRAATKKPVTIDRPRHRSNTTLASPRLVIKLPAAGDGNPKSRRQARRYRPVSHHFQDRDISLDGSPIGGRPIPLQVAPTHPIIMDATQRHSASPEDCSDGNDSHSAPSEFLAEFLSAIMRRQYAEALKYCRLILQYEPRNATARGFYPLLQQKLAQQSPRETRSPAPQTRSPRHRLSRRAPHSPDLAGASSGGNSGESSPTGQPPGLLQHEVMEQETDSLSCSESEGEARPGSAASSGEPEPGLGSVSSQSSLELDSSDAPARSSPSLSLSRRTDRTDHTDRTDSASASGTWDSSGSGARDDNGNPAPAHTTPPLTCCDAENNQAAAPRSPQRARPLTLQSEQSSESLRRLRAQFACSIK